MRFNFILVLVVLALATSTYALSCQALNATNVPFCAQYITWQIPAQDETADLQADSQAKQTATDLAGTGSDNCKAQMNKLICASSFPRCVADKGELQLPCYGDCQTVDLSCNSTTVALPTICAPAPSSNNTVPCNSIFIGSPNLALIILVPIIIIGALVIVVAVIAVVFFMFKKKDNYSSI